MSKGKRIKGGKPSAEDQAFAELQETVRSLEAQIGEALAQVSADLTTQLPAMLQAAIARAVEPYQAAEAMREKELLAEAHKGWGGPAANHHAGVIV